VSVRLRAATREDAELLFEWANEPTVRAASFDSASIPWQTHVAWLESRLTDDARCLIFIATTGTTGTTGTGEPFGQARLERDQGDITLSYSIETARRRRGLATPLIEAAVERCAALWPSVDRIRAEVRPDNVASARALARAGFRLHESLADRDVYVWSPGRTMSIPTDSRA